MEKSAEYLEFSAEGLSGNTKTIQFALSGELTVQFCPNYVQVLPKSLIKTYQHCMFSLKIPFRNNILVILIIYALLGGQFWGQDDRAFSADLFRLKGKIRRPFPF